LGRSELGFTARRFGHAYYMTFELLFFGLLIGMFLLVGMGLLARD
jgi:hypothetical protein